MRVLVVTNMWPSPERPYSGSFIVNHVKSLEDLGVETEVFFTNPRAGRSQYLRRLPQLRRVLAEGRWDVVHAQHSYCVHQVRSAAGRRRRPPLVYTCHEGEAVLGVSEWNVSDGLTKRFAYSRSVKRRAVAAADHVIFVTDALAAALAAGRSHEVIPPGVDMERFRPLDRHESRRDLDARSDEKIILWPADPAAKARLKGYDLFRAAIETIAPAPRVVTGGRIPPERMPAMMNAADAVVLTSRFEASPMVVKEAMACNRPVVSTRVGDVPLVVGAEPGHFLVDATAGAVAAGIEAALAFEGPTNGRARLTELQLSTVQTARRHLATYERLAANHVRT